MPDDARIGTRQGHAHAHRLAAPDKWLKELRIHGQSVFARLRRQEDVQQLPSRWNSDEDTPADAERAEIVVRLFRRAGQGKCGLTNGLERDCQSRPRAVSGFRAA